MLMKFHLPSKHTHHYKHIIYHTSQDFMVLHYYIFRKQNWQKYCNRVRWGNTGQNIQSGTQCYTSKLKLSEHSLFCQWTMIFGCLLCHKLLLSAFMNTDYNLRGLQVVPRFSVTPSIVDSLFLQTFPILKICLQSPRSMNVLPDWLLTAPFSHSQEFLLIVAWCISKICMPL